jgi:hypothetical protein
MTSEQSLNDNSLLEMVTPQDDSFRLTTSALIEFENQRNFMLQSFQSLEHDNKALKVEIELQR